MAIYRLTAPAEYWINRAGGVLLVQSEIVGLFNFAPYVGSVVSLGLITLASSAIFDTLAMFAFNLLEGNVITPMIHGRRFAMSALMVFAALFFLLGLDCRAWPAC